MDKKRLLDTFCEMVSIDSPSHGERDLCDYLSGRLRGLGLEVYEDNAGEAFGGNCGNLYGRLDGNLPSTPVLLCAHMDTVEPSRGKKAIIHSDGRITSDGGTVLGADDLAGIAAILEAIESVREHGHAHRPVEVLFTVAEEVYCKGARLFDYSRVQSREAYVMDLSGPVGTAAYKAPTILSFTAIVTGKPAHAGFAPQDGVHAIAAAADAISRIRMGRIDDETTCNIGTIEGGRALNIIPDSCTVKGEIRSFSHEKAMEQAALVEREFEASAQKLGAAVHFQSDFAVEAYETDMDHPVVKKFDAACASLGVPCELIQTFGGSDNNVFAKHGISGLVVTSAMYGCHSREEYSSADELAQVTALVTALITEA